MKEWEKMSIEEKLDDMIMDVAEGWGDCHGFKKDILIAFKIKKQIEDIISASKRVRSQGTDTTDYPKLLQEILDSS